MRECEFDPQKQRKHYKTAKKVTNNLSNQQGQKLVEIKFCLKRSESVIHEHTLHTCSHQKRFSKAKLEKTILSRDRVKKSHI